MSDLTHAVPRVPLSPARRRVLTAGIMTGMFLAALEATVIATAMPTVIASLGGMSHYSWVFSAYLLSSTVTVPVWGRLSDLYGRRILYQAGVVIFLAGSALSGLATTMTQLIVFRAIQGVGAGGLVPLGMTITGDIYTFRERAKMQGLFSGVWGLASVIGPLAGGFITDHWSWRWVFFLNIPVGIVAAIVVGLTLLEPRRHDRPSIDYLGALTMTTAITMLMLGLIGGRDGTLLTTRTFFFLSAAALLLVVFYFVERRADEPIVPFRLFGNPVVTISVIAGFLAGFAMFGAITFVPLFAQGARGATATAAGSLLTPLMLAWVAMSIIGGRLLLHVGYKSMVITGFALLVIGFGGFSTFTRSTPQIFLVIDLAVIGSGLGLSMLTLLLAVQHAVARNELGIATSLNQFFRSIGGAVGVAILGAILSIGLARQIDLATERSPEDISIEAHALADNPNTLIDPVERAKIAPAVVELLQESLARAIRPLFAISALVSLLALLAALMLPREHAAMTDARGDNRRSESAGERLIATDMTTLEAGDGPDGTRGSS